MSRSALPFSLASHALLLAAGLGSVAHATEIAPPPPLGAGAADVPDGLTLLREWTMEATLGRVGSNERRYPTLDVRDADDTPPPLVTVEAGTGTPLLHIPGPHAAGLTPLPLPMEISGGRGGAFDLILDATTTAASDGALALEVPTGASLAGGTRFDVRPATRNPVEIDGDVVDDLVAAVVRTPEPGTLALFALGTLGLLAWVARRRRSGRALATSA